MVEMAYVFKYYALIVQKNIEQKTICGYNIKYIIVPNCAFRAEVRARCGRNAAYSGVLREKTI